MHEQVYHVFKIPAAKNRKGEVKHPFPARRGLVIFFMWARMNDSIIIIMKV